ncbi:hypothetical protein [Mesorhizobium sp.]|uniref:hypothetical protein n=1 Tax=Mesorhizobium sp. TaxID=1871066 RepID=UPI000FE6E962|nr:hypothetical protein [Mesorhizobium sp.]RWP63687.1 MAG: hypothetical protein EOR07_18000 [Mesorhizobium sp.]
MLVRQNAAPGYLHLEAQIVEPLGSSVDDLQVGSKIMRARNQGRLRLGPPREGPCPRPIPMPLAVSNECARFVDIRGMLRAITSDSANWHRHGHRHNGIRMAAGSQGASLTVLIGRKRAVGQQAAIKIEGEIS